MRSHNPIASIGNSSSLLASLIAAVLVFSPVFLMSLWSGEAQAHKGHGGPMVTLMKKKEALKAMLPGGAKIVKRKQKVDSEAAERVEDAYGVDLANSIYTYYLAKDRENGKFIGAAIVQKFSYRHGDVSIAVGIDADQRITKAAITGVSEKYIPEFEGTVGTGFIDKYEGMTLKELAEEVAALGESADKPTRLFMSRLLEAAALLDAFLHSAR